VRAVALAGQQPTFLRAERRGGAWFSAGLGAAHPDSPQPKAWGAVGLCWDGTEHAVVDVTRMAYLRGQVVYADLGHGRKPWLVVSNNQRNASRKGDVLAVRLTTMARAVELPTVVRLSTADQPFVGSVLCDDPYVIANEEIAAAAGALHPPTMRAVDEALRIALGL
jgi:mRNA interferase MazF